IEQRVALRQDLSGVRQERALQCGVERLRVECQEFLVALAVVFHEAPQRPDRAVVSVRTRELDVPEGLRTEAVAVRWNPGGAHSPKIIATTPATPLAGADLPNRHIVELIVAERRAVVANRALEREERLRAG